MPFQGATAPTRDTQGVASLALGYVLHWAFSPPLLNPELEYSNNIFSLFATYITNHKLQVQTLFFNPNYNKKGGCPRLSTLHIRLCLYPFYEATSSLRIYHNPSFVFLLSEDSFRRSTYQTMLTILLVSYYHSAQNVCRPMTVAVCNNGVVYKPS